MGWGLLPRDTKDPANALRPFMASADTAATNPTFAQHADRRRPGVAELTAQAYRRIRCGECANQFNERSADVLNRAQDPSDSVSPQVWRLHYARA